MDLTVKTKTLDLSLSLAVDEQEMAQLILLELSQAGALGGTTAPLQTLMAQYMAHSQTMLDLSTRDQHVLPMGHVPSQHVLPMGHVPSQHVLPMGHVPSIPDSTLGHVPSIPVPETKYIPNIPDRVAKEPSYRVEGTSPRWGLISVLIGASIGLLLLSWRFHSQQTTSPTEQNKTVTSSPPSNPPAFTIKKKS
jgi:hypothetical protein